MTAIGLYGFPKALVVNDRLGHTGTLQVSKERIPRVDFVLL